MKYAAISRYTGAANWLLIIYLSIMVTGCSFRPAELSPEEARLLQTRDFNGSPEEVAKAVTMVLQEMHYTLGNVDMGLGVITATRTSERSLAPISREAGEPELNEVETFCLVAGAVAIVGIVLAIIFGDDDEDEEEDRENRGRHSRRSSGHHHGNSWSLFGSNDSYSSGPDSYSYTMTISLEPIPPGQTRVRATVQGKHLEGGGIAESGPVQSQEFYVDFFTRLHKILNK